MKKLVSILMLVSICLVAFNQSTMKTIPQKTITLTDWSFNYTGSLADSVGIVQDSLQYPIFINCADSLDGEIKVVLTEITSPARTIVQYQNRRSSTDTWTTSLSYLYTGVGTDTTLRIRKATYNAWPYKRLLFITNSATKVKAYPSKISGYYKK